LAYFTSVLGSGADSQLVEAVAGVDPRVSWADPLMGEWWIDPSRCYYDRPLPFPPDPEGWTPLKRDGVRPTSGAGGIGVGKWTYAPEGDGVRTFYFFGNGPDSTSAHMMQYFATWDGVPWADPHSTLLPGQLAQVWRLDPYCIVRLVLDNNSPVYARWEWAVWAPATDGRSFACTSWDSTAPDRHNLQVFEKFSGPVYPPDGAGAPQASAIETQAPSPLADTDPALGTWVIVPEKSSFLRQGQDVATVLPDVIPDQKWSFKADAAGMLLERFDTPDDLASATSASYRLDGIDHADSRGTGESVACWKIGPELIVRRISTADGARSWSLLAFSADGGTMSVTSWDQDTPANRDIQVFRKL
jgi:hypothetical protein